MDPITLIVMALAAGASSGAIDALKDNAKDAAKTAYGKLHDLVKRRFRGNTSAEVVLAEHQADPDTYQLPLVKKLTETDAADDAELVAAAAEVMKLVDPAQARVGKFNVTIHDGQGIIVGDNGFQVNDFRKS
jgi:tetraacyldisaccharide-1-P 4'-kinase